MNLISYPFRLTVTGQVATVDQDSDPARAEQIAVLLLTRKGERALVPEFGVTDMVGHGFDESDLVAGMAMFGPSVTLTDVTVGTVGQDTQHVTVTFE